MNDKEMFEKWRLDYISTHTGYFKMIGTDDLAQVVWQAACAYKQEEITLLENQISYLEETIDSFMDEPDIVIKKLQTKNAKLEKCLRLFAFPEGTLEHEAVERAARQCLKAINED